MKLIGKKDLRRVLSILLCGLLMFGGSIPALAAVNDPNTLECGNIYTGAITVKDGGGNTAGTFTYVYTDGLYINEYLLEGLTEVLKTEYSIISAYPSSAELASAGWKAYYSTTGTVDVDTTAAGIQTNWADVSTIVSDILGMTPVDPDVGQSRDVGFQYNVSNEDAYEMVNGALVKSDKTGITNVNYVIHHSTADTGVKQLTVSLSESGGRVLLAPQAAEAGYAFYYTTGATSATPPASGDGIGTIVGAAAYSASTDIGPEYGSGSGNAMLLDQLYVQVYKVETTGNTIVGYGEGIGRSILDGGKIYTGTISVKQNGSEVGTFIYVYTDGLYTNEYLLASMKDVLPSEYAGLLSPSVGSELYYTNWYKNYSTTGSVSVDAAAAAEKSNWASVSAIVTNILGCQPADPVTDGGAVSNFQYRVSGMNSYEIVNGALQRSDKQVITGIGYTSYSSSANAVSLPANASLTVNGTALVTAGAATGSSVSGAAYDLAANTLTLSGYSGGAIKASEMDLNLVLTGNNTVTGSESMGVVQAYSFDNSPKLTISGNGTLAVNNTKASGTSYGIYGWTGVDIQSGTVVVNMTAAGYTYGIGTNRYPITVDVSQGASVTSTVAGGTNAAHAMVGSAVTITGSATIKEGDNEAGAQTVSSLTMTTIDVGEATKKYVSITPPGGPQTPTVSSVAVNPASITVKKGQTQQFTATVTGTSNPAQTVTWSVSGGGAGTSIDRNGLLTIAAGETASTLTVTAKSTVDTSKFGIATVSVSNANEGGSGGTTIAAPKITVKKNDKCSITAAPSNPAKGDTVTVTVTPHEGYRVESVTVRDKSGNKFIVTENSNGTYGFVYGDGEVTIEAELVPLSELPIDRPPFTDISEGDWFYEYVIYVWKNGLMVGTSDTDFSPNAEVTRGMFATILWRLESEPAAATANPFTDMTQSWYADAVAWASGHGIVSGYGGGLFGPEDSITREDLALMLYRYAKWAGLDVSASADLGGYADASAISGYALDAMKWANAEGLITGRSATELAPKGTATRAELAAILHRFSENIG